MSDLIERLEKYLNAIPDDLRYTSPNDFVRMLDESLTALREQEDEAIKAKDYMVELSATVTSQQAHIAELERYEEKCQALIKYWRDEKIEAVEAVMAEIGLLIPPQDQGE
jgi:hypothetical protein